MPSSEPNRRAGPAATLAAERQLLDRLRAGDRPAFAAVVAQHGSALLRLASALVRDRAVAEEVVQDAWVAALDGLDRFEGRASLRTWLFQIVANKARTRAVREGRSVPLSALGGPTDGGEPDLDADRFDEAGGWRSPPGPWAEQDPERLVQEAQTRAAIERAIAALPEAQRAVITLRDVEGLETEEICGLLGLTVTNQRVLLHRARTRVRLALELALSDPAPR